MMFPGSQHMRIMDIDINELVSLVRITRPQTFAVFPTPKSNRIVTAVKWLQHPSSRINEPQQRGHRYDLFSENFLKLNLKTAIF